jgi:hypothetical protein
MPFTGNYTTNTFKQGLLNGDFDFAVDTIEIALYTNAATLDASTTAYTTVGEVVGTGYTAGGNTLTPTVSICRWDSFCNLCQYNLVWGVYSPWCVDLQKWWWGNLRVGFRLRQDFIHSFPSTVSRCNFD